MPPPKINHASGHVLLFDLDGTLADPRAGIVRCMRYALDKLGVSSPSDDILASSIGPPLRGTFATLLETSDMNLVERALALYREEYGTTGLFEWPARRMLCSREGVEDPAFLLAQPSSCYPWLSGRRGGHQCVR